MFLIITHFSLLVTHQASAQSLTLVELNCENLFDARHDEGKDDSEWLPDALRHWTRTRYWRKVNNIGQELLSCTDGSVPDLIALVEVENDSALIALTRRSLFRRAGYQYLMTQSSDLRGIDVALLYQPLLFRPLCYETLHVQPLKGMRPTRDILYVQGETLHRRPDDGAAPSAVPDSTATTVVCHDTLHVFVVHAPSRFGGERATRPFRQQVMERLMAHISTLPADAKIIVAGDFNDYHDSPSLKFLASQGLHNVTAEATGRYGIAPATYRYQGEWRSIDHILLSPTLLPFVDHAYINDAPFLLEEDSQYGGHRPLRTFNGMRYQRGFSDHLPLVVRLRW